MRFYLGYSHWLWQLTAIDCFVLDIIISDYFVIYMCNLEQFENKVTHSLARSLTHSPTHTPTHSRYEIEFLIVVRTR